MPEYPTPITGLPPGRVDVLIVEDERELAEATAEYLDAMGSAAITNRRRRPLLTS